MTSFDVDAFNKKVITGKEEKRQFNLNFLLSLTTVIDRLDSVK